MPLFEYKALNKKGREIKGSLEADNLEDARLRLREKEVYPTQLSARPVRLLSKRLFERVGPMEVAVATRQLSTLLSAGTPLVAALSALASQLRDRPFKRVIIEVRDKVIGGSDLAGALRGHRRAFSPLYVSMVGAGESSGGLDISLARLADFLEAQVRLTSRIRAILAYPILMVVVATGIILFLLTFILPIVTKIFQEMRGVLPLPTHILIQVSSFLKGFWWAILAFVILAWVAIRGFLKTKRGRSGWDKFALRIPIFGELLLKKATARFARTLSTLTASGVPLLRGLDIAANIVGNIIMSGVVKSARDAVSRGKDLSGSLGRDEVFPPLMIHMIGIGEKSGRLEEMLEKVADICDNEVENRLSVIMSLLEPAIILLMGLAVLFIVLAVLLPIFEMNQMIR